jgi:Alpha amylase, catalytic domain
MMNQPKYPSLYQINTRVWLTEISGKLGRKATLDDIPDTALDDFVAMGFDWIWFLSVWTTGQASRAVSLAHSGWRHDFENTLPDLQEEDIGGSGFAIAGYTVHPDLGGDDALQRLRVRMHQRGLKLMLDFVPNHMGPDHPWLETNSGYFISGTEADLLQHPKNYRKIHTKQGDLVLAYGRDPYFEGWPDTIQLDYSNPGTVEAMTGELCKVSGQCDGVRCDMAMLVLPEVFEKTWGRRAEAFWPIAIKAVRERSPGFVFMAEVYWEMEWALQQQGFDYAYDKRLYDRLAEGHAKPIREHFYAGLDYQNKLARFLENHDEPRAAVTFEPEKHLAAAIITFLSPCLRFFHQGEFEGRTKRISPHLVRAPRELPQAYLVRFYGSLLQLLTSPVFREGTWQLLEPVPAWEGNGSWESFILFAWHLGNNDRVLIAVNFALYAGQCFVKLPFPDLTSGHYRLTDMMGDAQYDRNGDDMYSRGLYLDMPAWGYHVFSLIPIAG